MRSLPVVVACVLVVACNGATEPSDSQNPYPAQEFRATLAITVTTEGTNPPESYPLLVCDNPTSSTDFTNSCSIKWAIARAVNGRWPSVTTLPPNGVVYRSVPSGRVQIGVGLPDQCFPSDRRASGGTLLGWTRLLASGDTARAEFRISCP